MQYTCAYCGKIFHSVKKRGKNTFCSRACMNKHYGDKQHKTQDRTTLHKLLRYNKARTSLLDGGQTIIEMYGQVRT